MKYKGLKYKKGGEILFPDQTQKILNEGGFVSADDLAAFTLENSKAAVEAKNAVQGEGWRYAGEGAKVAAGVGAMFVPGLQGVGVGLIGSGIKGTIDLASDPVEAKENYGAKMVSDLSGAGLSALTGAVNAGDIDLEGLVRKTKQAVIGPEEVQELTAPSMPNIAGNVTGGQVQRPAFKDGGLLYGDGGSTVFTTTKQDNGLIVLNGKDHEDGGIDLKQGVEVEGGETIYNDFVFTNSHTITKDIAEKHSLPSGSVGKTYAAASKHYAKYYDERPNDPHARESFEENMARLEQAHLDGVPQSRPENIPLETANAELQGFGPQARNGGGIMWYVDSVPFKSGGAMDYLKQGGYIKYEDGGKTDPDRLSRAYQALYDLIQAQFDEDGTIRVGNNTLNVPTFDTTRTELERINEMEPEEKAQAIGQLYAYMSQKGFINYIPEDVDLQVLDYYGDGIEVQDNRIDAMNAGLLPPSSDTDDAAWNTDGPQELITENPLAAIGNLRNPDEPIGFPQPPQSTRPQSQRSATPPQPVGSTMPEEEIKGTAPDAVNPVMPVGFPQPGGSTMPVSEVGSSKKPTVKSANSYQTEDGTIVNAPVAPDFTRDDLALGLNKDFSLTTDFFAGISDRTLLEDANEIIALDADDDLDRETVRGLGKQTPTTKKQTPITGTGEAQPLGFNLQGTEESTDPISSFVDYSGLIDTYPGGDTGGGTTRKSGSDSDKNESNYADYLRYAPIAGSLTNLITTAANRPGKLSEASFQIQDDYRKQEIDKELLQREADIQSADLREAITQGATTQSGLMNAIAAISADTAKAKTDAVIKGQLFDAEEGRMAEQFERQKDTFNKQVALNVQNMNDANNAAFTSNMMDSIAEFTQNLGNLGKDEEARKRADKLFAYNTKGEYTNPNMMGVMYALNQLGLLNEENLKQLWQNSPNNEDKE